MPIKPRGEFTQSSTPKKFYQHVLEPQIELAVWCPDDEAKAPPEQVHFIVHWSVGETLPPMVIRFKSPDTLGFLIEQLTRYRREVWKDAEKVEGEK